jgi:hypothetical protein
MGTMRYCDLCKKGNKLVNSVSTVSLGNLNAYNPTKSLYDICQQHEIAIKKAMEPFNDVEFTNE